MVRFIKFTAMMAFTMVAASACTGDGTVQSVMAESEMQYAVLSPWADIDPIPVRGISPRLDSLAGKKIGLFANFKRAAVPIMTEVEKRLKERFPDIEIHLFHSTLPNVTETETANKEKFSAWATGMDAVVGAVGD